MRIVNLAHGAFAAAPVITETKTPAVVFNAGSPPVVRKSPYFVRVSNTVWQDAVPAAEWAIKQGKKKAYVAVADYAPGHDVADGFKAKFTALGGTIVGDDRIALNTVDFAPVAQRIAATPADVVMVFMPSGAPDLGLIKALATQGLIAKRTVIGFALGSDLAKLPADAAGYYTIGHYAEGLDNADNRSFKQAVSAKFGKKAVADFLTVSSYDGTHLLYRMVEAQKGKAFDGDAAIAAVRGYHWKSPSGELSIDAATRDIVANEYIQRVEMADGVPTNKIVYTFAAVKDPWAASHPAK
jgi:branched-chain amino acid transport system substrate-binding protein